MYTTYTVNTSNTMKTETFIRCMAFFGYDPGSIKSTALYLVMVEGKTQTEASRSTGYSPSQLSAVYKRVRRDLARVRDLTGVDLCA